MQTKTFWEKVLLLVTSVRFWVITLAAASAAAAAMKAAGGFDVIILLDTIKIWLATVAGIGTLDKIAEKFSPKPVEESSS